jgi:hypothetical protein
MSYYKIPAVIVIVQDWDWWRGPVIQLLGGHKLWTVIGG